ncbi:cation-dependent mannose-6-phosphate receptor isoform X2 [Genypterus blacodes]|uniref:cation-dependent mannose-6-phosphate receptor isoform X2 n=1 Tax=Genypterus blacodes TaxID=154954 RepID=UPI003F763AAC
MKVCLSPSGGLFLLWTLAVLLPLCGTGVYASDNTKNCKLSSDKDLPPSEQEILSRLEPLTKKDFRATTKVDKASYTYVFQLCGDAAGVPGAGVLQMDNSNMTKPVIIGMYNATQLIGGSDWVMLIYRSGEHYDNHCNNEMRQAMVMISCSSTAGMGQLEAIREEYRPHECFYLFELDSSAVCPALDSRLSTGSVILIIGFCLVAVYLIGGFLYQRLIVGAKGMEQFPNYAFWVEFGNLVADGCDFMCRSRNREEPPAYRGVATEPLEDEPEERDDHLLPM